MTDYPRPALLSKEDYATIEAAVMETERGRWFLKEYACRNRNADSEAILAVLDRLETVIVKSPQEEIASNSLRPNITDIGYAIERAKQDIALIRQDDQTTKPYERLGYERLGHELEEIIQQNVIANRTIEQTIEDIQDVVCSLREQTSNNSQTCDNIHTKITDINAACLMQDVTNQCMARIAELISEMETHSSGISQFKDIEEKSILLANGQAEIGNISANTFAEQERHISPSHNRQKQELIGKTDRQNNANDISFSQKNIQYPDTVMGYANEISYQGKETLVVSPSIEDPTKHLSEAEKLALFH